MRSTTRDTTVLALWCATMTLLCGCSSDDDPVIKPDAGRTPIADATSPDAPLDPGSDAGGVSADDWPMLGQNSHSTYRNQNERTISVETAGDLEVAWTQDLGTNITGAPIQVGGRICAVGLGVYCFDAATGKQLWHAPDIQATSSLAFASGQVIVNDRDGVLHAFDAEDGSKTWEHLTSDQSGLRGFSSPTVAGKRVLVGGSTFDEVSGITPAFRGFALAVDAETGDELWKTHTVPEGSTGASLWSSLAIDEENERVVGATGNNYTEPATDTSDAILSMDLANGSLDWKQQLLEGDVWSFATAALGNPDFDFGANPVLFEAEVDGTLTPLVAAGQKSGDAHVLRRDDGSVVWSRNLSGGTAAGDRGIFNNGAWDGEHVLFVANSATSSAPGGEPEDPEGTGPSVLFALEPATGDIAWEHQLPDVVMAPVTVAGGVVFVGAGRHLLALDAKDGRRLFEYVSEETVATAPTVAQGRVAFGGGLSYIFGWPGATLTVLEIP